MTRVEKVFTASIGGKVFCGLIHITVLNWLVWYENFLLKFICFIFHQESAILGKIRLPHAGFSFYLFQDESLFSSFNQTSGHHSLLHQFCPGPGSSGETPGDGHTVAIRNDSDQHLGHPSGRSILLSPSSYCNG